MPCILLPHLAFISVADAHFKMINSVSPFWQGKITPNGTRDSTLELLLGDNGWVTHYENDICYSLDATKCMFSSGNRSEKLRIGQLNCRDEVVVDLFAGIGYFVLPFLVKYVLWQSLLNTSDFTSPPPPPIYCSHTLAGLMPS